MNEDDDDDERDLRLQRGSVELLKDIRRELPRLLWKKHTRRPREAAQENLQKPQTLPRKYVSLQRLSKMIDLLEAFQEWPQLLDRDLARLVPSLVDAFLQSLPVFSNRQTHSQAQSRADWIFLPQGICQILYILCKVRGEKVISRLLSSSPSHLELILDAYQSCSEQSFDEQGSVFLTWQEKYVMLLWLSHLLLVPFDIQSMSSESTAYPSENDTMGPKTPRNSPLLASRLIRISCQCLNFAGKERGPAILVLLRLLLRRDMQALGVSRGILKWALSCAGPTSIVECGGSDLRFLGVIALLAAYIKSAPPEILAPIFDDLKAIAKNVPSETHESILTQRIMIKIYRSLAIKANHVDDRHWDFIETAVEHIFERLTAPDTSLRFTASKALATVAAQIETAAADILEMVLAEFNDDHASLQPQSQRPVDEFQSKERSPVEMRSVLHNFQSVNGNKWHGLTLTLSQLALQRSIPSESLPKAIVCLETALHFEQKTVLGSSTGANVRDAALLGLWSLVRKSSTDEICQTSRPGASALQHLASQLVMTACLDPVGNIRRAASATLQESIGRHPDSIACGEMLRLVHLVDYHAISSRSRAMFDVSLEAALIDQSYFQAVFNGLLSWRCIFFEDRASRKDVAAQIRRNAASAFGQLCFQHSIQSVQHAVDLISEELKGVTSISPARTHGLLYTLSAMTSMLMHPHYHDMGQSVSDAERDILRLVQEILLNEVRNNTSGPLRARASESAEATAALIASIADLNAIGSKMLMSNQTFLDERGLQLLVKWLTLTMNDQGSWSCPEIGAQALEACFRLLGTEMRHECIQDVLQKLSKARGRARLGVIACLSSVFKYTTGKEAGHDSDESKVLSVLVQETKSSNPIEARAHSLVWLDKGVVSLDVFTPEIYDTLIENLTDYTIDQRGDIGSLVRMEAIQAAATAIAGAKADNVDSRERRLLTALICGLATEKLDRVRMKAAQCLQKQWNGLGLNSFSPPPISDLASVSSHAYFQTMLQLSSDGVIAVPLLRGFIASAGAGSDSLIQASRLALQAYTTCIDHRRLHDLCDDLLEILSDAVPDGRLTIPALEVFDFLFEVGVMSRLKGTGFKFKRLASLVNKAHYRSTRMPKLDVSIRLYRDLASIPETRTFAVEKLTSFLHHRYASIRASAAEALLLLTYTTTTAITNTNPSTISNPDIITKSTATHANRDAKSSSPSLSTSTFSRSAASSPSASTQILLLDVDWAQEDSTPLRDRAMEIRTSILRSS